MDRTYVYLFILFSFIFDTAKRSLGKKVDNDDDTAHIN